MNPLGTFTFEGPAGRLEGLYRAGREDAARAALVCRPHPQDGGTMHNKVVYRSAKAFEKLGYPVLRFNYRGVGASEGGYGQGAGEAEDVRAALDWLTAEHRRLSIVLAGFSFGSVVGLPVGAADDRVGHLVGLGIPTSRFPFDALADCGKPKLFIQGDRDEFGPLDALRSALERVAEPLRLAVVEDADHFFTDRLEIVQREIAAYFGDRDVAPH